MSSRRRVSFNPLIVQDTGSCIGVNEGGHHAPHIPTCTGGNGGNGIVTNTSVGHNSSNGSGVGTGSSGSGGGNGFSNDMSNQGKVKN